MNIENIGIQTGFKPLGVIFEKNEDRMLTEKTSTQPFDTFFKTYLNLIEETNAYQIKADESQIDYASGKTDDMLAVMLAQEKAFASLNFTVQVTNRVIDAYKEIMRISL